MGNCTYSKTYSKGKPENVNIRVNQNDEEARESKGCIILVKGVYIQTSVWLLIEQMAILIDSARVL